MTGFDESLITARLDRHDAEKDAVIRHGEAPERTYRTGWYTSGDVLPDGSAVPDSSDDISVQDLIRYTRLLEARRWIINAVDSAVRKLVDDRHLRYSMELGTFVARFPQVSMCRGPGTEFEIIAAETSILREMLCDPIYSLCPLDVAGRMLEDLAVTSHIAKSIIDGPIDPDDTVERANEDWLDANGLWYVHASIAEDYSGIDFELISALDDEHADVLGCEIAENEGIPEDEMVVIGPYATRYEASCAIEYFIRCCRDAKPDTFLLDDLQRFYSLRLDHRFRELV